MSYHGHVKAWSISTLSKYQECPLKIYFEKIQKIPQPDSPALARGNKVHEEAELFVKGELEEMPESLLLYEEGFNDLLVVDADVVSIEDDWAFKADWSRCEWLDPEAWARFKFDYFNMKDNEGRVIDYKTGKRYPVKHVIQMLYYSIVLFVHYQDMTHITTELWYLDDDKAGPAVKRYSRAQAMLHYKSMMENALKMTTPQFFVPTPSGKACRFCPYKRNPCDHFIE